MADMVRAMVQTGPRKLELREFAKPSAGQDGALLRVESNGACGSDIEQYEDHEGRRSYPAIPGHEFIGIIEDMAPAAAKRS